MGRTELGEERIRGLRWPCPQEAINRSCPVCFVATDICPECTARKCQDTVDANFDGFQDFGYLFHAGNQPYYRHYWLWDEEQRQFQYCAPLVHISQAVFDPERQVIIGWARSSGAGDGIHTFHRWEDGELVCVRRIKSHSPWEEPSTVSVMDRINGELQQVYYKEFPWSSEEPEGQEAWRQVCYKWYDLDYHGGS